MQRSERVGDEMRTIIAGIVQNGIRDPRLPPMVSVVDVDLSRDLSHARVYISVLGDEAVKRDCVAALRSATGYIRREIGSRMRLRIVPELNFIFDDSIERGVRISELIDQTVAADRRRAAESKAAIEDRRTELAADRDEAPDAESATKSAAERGADRAANRDEDRAAERGADVPATVKKRRDPGKRG